VQLARAVHALDPDQLDVAGRRRTRDQRVRPRRIEPGEPVGQVGRDLIGPHDHQVEVRHQGERPAALTWPVIQDDGPGLGDRDRAAGDDPGHPVEFGRGQRRGILGQLDPGPRGQPFRRDPGRHHDGPGHGVTASRQHPAHRVGQARKSHPLHHGPVVGGALGEQLRDVTGMVRPEIGTRQRRVLRVDVRRASTDGGTDPGQHLVP
jgi:hypothetical protein